jgi:hypothetical protein
MEKFEISFGDMMIVLGKSILLIGKLFVLQREKVD